MSTLNNSKPKKILPVLPKVFYKFEREEKVNSKSGLGIITDSAAQTAAVGSMLSLSLKAGEVVFLKGDLGSGKTTFVQGIAAALGVKEKAKSSSFILVNAYSGKRIKKIYHIDLYRLNSLELDDLGFEEYFTYDTLTMVEWPQKLEASSIKPDWIVEFSYLEDNQRKIVVKNTK